MDTWDSIYADLCSVVARRSKDTTQVGACVVDARHSVLGIGFNGAPRRMTDALVPAERPHKYKWMVHAETNAILFAIKAHSGFMLEHCTLYTNAIICSKCMLLAAQVGIVRVVCGSVKPHMCPQQDIADTRAIASACGVELQL